MNPLTPSSGSDDGLAAQPQRDPVCVERWPECESGAYDPRCCRFPKSCSCTSYPPDESPAASPSGLCPCGQPLGHDARAYWKGNVQVWFTVPGHTVEDAAERMEWFASRVKEALNDAGIYPQDVRPNRGMGSTELSLIPDLSK